jgi:hypothetical protein
MNFYSHAVIASWLSSDLGFVLGSMLPDLCRMAGEKPIRTADALADGGVCHVRTDEVFHAHREFRRLCSEAFDELRTRGLARGSAKAAAHIGVELLIDGALYDDTHGRTHYLQSVQAAPALLRAHPISPALTRVLSSLQQRGALREHTAPSAIARRIDYATQGRRRLALGPGDLSRIDDWAETARADVESAAPSLVRDVAEGIGTAPPKGSPLDEFGGAH